MYFMLLSVSWGATLWRPRGVTASNVPEILKESSRI
jgi:hypothetical protein